jgi:diguanylate cyclase (GGDEF)-like protein/PAS domain S-box-containing protein
MTMRRNRRIRDLILAAALLIVAIAAAAALLADPLPVIRWLADDWPQVSLAMDVGAVPASKGTSFVLGAGAAAAAATAVIFILIMRQRSQRHKLLVQRLEQEKQRLDMAINNMSQGLLLFDSSERIVVCNRRYIEMYGLSADVVKPGCTFRELICHRKETGSFVGDVDKYCCARLRDLSQGKITETIIRTPDGRSIEIVHEPMPDGGWVSTHEDITEKQRLLQAQDEAQELLRKQKLQLDAALNNMLQGLCMFDAEARIVLVNQRYAEMMGLPSDNLLGRSLLDLLERRMATENFACDPKQLFGEILAAVRAGRSTTRIMESNDGRALRVVDQPMINGGWVATFEDITEQRRIEKERDRDREFLNQIVDNVPLMIVVKDAGERKFVLANRAAEAYWGFSRTEAIGKRICDLFPHAQFDVIDRLDVEALQSDTPLLQEAHPTLMISGDPRLVTSKRIAIRDSDNRPQFLVSVIEDVTERKRLEQERDRDREFLNQIINNVPATIIVKDVRSRRYVLINQAGVEYFGASRDKIIGRTTHEVFPKETADLIVAHDEQVLRSDGYVFFEEYVLNTLGKGPCYVTSKKIVIRDSKGEPQYLLGVIEDVTERKNSEERIAHLAHYDALTDLPNRVLFRERLEQAIKRIRAGEHVAVLYLDLDNFKGINDSLGHPVGDELMKAVAARLRGCVGETDTVARLGGDEFAIIQTAGVHPTGVIDLVSRIHEAIRTPFDVVGHQLVADTSIGIALAPDDGTDPDQLLKNADLALYGAKADGRGTYRFFEPDMDARVKERRALEFDMRQAIMCDGFEIFYQPVVNLRDKKISGCEALLRWRHPERGLISPADFVPIAEETGLINLLGEWVLRSACAEAAAWPGDVKVAVNVSAVQFKSGNLAQLVLNALTASGLPAHRLELEITESVLIRDDESTLLILHQLRDLGVQIVLDDFGTGYSSLNYLHRFPFDKIKIDRSFIKTVAETDGSLSIVLAVVSIAQSRDITTTAEGVETQYQMDLLRSLGCTEIQGFLFSPPRPAAEILPLLLSPCDTSAAVA